MMKLTCARNVTTIFNFIFLFLLLLTPPESLAFDVSYTWQMTPRFGLDIDGNEITDAFDTPAEINPGQFQVMFNGCGSTIDKTWRTYPIYYEWMIDDTLQAIVDRCDTTIPLTEGNHTVRLRLRNTRDETVTSAQDEILIQDWLIVSVGDSYASGEGNPDVLPLTEGASGYDLGQCGYNTFMDAREAIIDLRALIADTGRDIQGNLQDHLDQARADLNDLQTTLVPVYMALYTWGQSCFPQFLWQLDVLQCSADSQTLINRLGAVLSGIDLADLVSHGYDAVVHQIDLLKQDREDAVQLAEDAIASAQATVADGLQSLEELYNCINEEITDSRLGGRWVDEQCHRSMNSKEAIAALELERLDPHTSVTFVSTACSGATIRSGLLGQYSGPRIQPAIGDFDYCINDRMDGLSSVDQRNLEIQAEIHEACCNEVGGCKKPQLDEVARLVGDREIDALLISIGGNDINFAPIIKNCMTTDYCDEDISQSVNIRDFFQDTYCVNASSQFDWLPGFEQYLYERCLDASDSIPNAGIIEEYTAKDMFYDNIGSLPALYSTLRQRIAEGIGVIPQHIYITEYPNATKDENGQYCYSQGTPEDVLRMLPGFHTRETQWADQTVTVQLNEKIHATSSYGWQVVTGIYDLYGNDSGVGHGYCSSQQWFRRIQESLAFGSGLNFDSRPYYFLDENGTMHPTREGNYQVATRILLPQLQEDLYLDGEPRPLSGRPVAGLQDSFAMAEGDSITLYNKSYDSVYGYQLEYLWTRPLWLWWSYFDDPSMSSPAFTAEESGSGWLSLRVTNPAGISAVRAASLTVENRPPTVSFKLAKGRYYEWSAYNLTVEFSDPGIHDSHTLAVDWGDNSTSEMYPESISPTVLSHTYREHGNYTIQVSVRDDDGGIGTAVKTVEILPHPLAQDDDGDGYSEFQGDCNDDDRWTVFPGAPEICDHRDNDCDGQIDEGLLNNCGVIFVKADASGNNDGSSWTDAFTSLQDALSVVVTGQHIWVSKGAYYPTNGSDRSISFAIPNGVRLYGGFRGDETSLSERNIPNYQAILSGDIGVLGDEADNSYHVLTQAGPFADHSTRIDGFIIANGNATDASTNPYGGGMNFRDGPLVVNCTFLDNSAMRGGAFYGDGETVGGSHPEFVNCKFINNLGKDYGGAVFHQKGSNPAFINCLFSSNSSNNGGAIALDNVDAANILFSTLADNSAKASGGAVWVKNDGTFTTSSHTTITGTILSRNTSETDAFELAITGKYQSVTIEYSAITEDKITDPDNVVVFGTHNETGNDIVFMNPLGPDDTAGTLDDNYRLRENSGGIGLVDSAVLPEDTADIDEDGITAEQLPWDLDNRSRFYKDLDMGAYENGALAWYVDESATGSGDGLSWSSPLAFLQDALASALPGDEIFVAEGVYRSDLGSGIIAGDRMATFKIPDGVKIYGGYRSGGGVRDTKYYPSILSGDINVINDQSDNSYHVVNAYGTSNDTLLDGFTITGGNASPNYHPQNKGGGVLIGDGDIVLSGCRIQDNKAYHRGGGIWVSRGRPRISTTIVIANSAMEGGGIATENRSSANLRNCSFLGNRATQNAGAMYSSNSLNGVRNCVFSGNRANSLGGAVLSTNSDGLTIQNATFIADSAQYGGGLFVNLGALVSVDNSIFWNNVASQGSQIGISEASVNVIWTDIEGGLTNLYSQDPVSLLHDNITDFNPLFTNPKGSDQIAGTDDDNVHLALFSLAIDAGNPVSGFFYEPNDPAGSNGGRINLGAYGNTAEASVTRLSGGETMYVNQAATGKETGSSWQDAFTSLQYALQTAKSGDSIAVAKGFYKPDNGPGQSAGDQTASFVLKNGVGVYGGFKAFDPWEARNPKQNLTILSGDLNGDDEDNFANYAENSQHVVVGSGTDASAIIDGFTIRGGNATSASTYPQNGGAGMYNEAGSPTIRNCVFEYNTAQDRGGGGILNHGNSAPAISFSTFRNNRGGNGAAIYNAYTSSAHISNSLFHDNGGNYGGAIELVYSSNALIENCTFSNNLALTRGGAVHVFASSPQVANSIFWNNGAPTGQGHEFGLDNASLTIRYSDVAGGQADIALATSSVNWNAGNLVDIEPMFTDTLYHLHSESPCVDAGDPVTDYASERQPNGGRINMGAYGNSSDAAVSITDSDHDGIDNSIELTSCTDPLDADSDDDGIIDSGEDTNLNGVLDEGETDPCDEDTDNDGIPDGMELGYSIEGVGPYTNLERFQPDLDPMSLTNPLLQDSDGDGVNDDVEDANHNGRWDLGETSSQFASGDFNLDSIANLTDLLIVLQVMTNQTVTGAFEKGADTDGDQKTTFIDVFYLLEKVGATP